MLGQLAIPTRKMEMEKMEKKHNKMKLDLHLTHPEEAEHLYAESKTLKYFHNLRDKQRSLSNDTQKCRTQKADTSEFTKMKTICTPATS